MSEPHSEVERRRAVRRELERNIEANITSFFSSVMYAAPEMMSLHKERLKENIISDIDSYLDGLDDRS